MALANPPEGGSEYPFFTWVLGSATGVFLIAVFSDCIFRNRLVFMPLIFFAVLEFCLQLGVLIADILTPNFMGNNKYILFFEGMVESSLQFYIYFLTPILIATEHRVTQEVTPAATITSTTMAVTYGLSRYVKGLLMSSIHPFVAEEKAPFLKELIPLVLVGIAILII